MHKLLVAHLSGRNELHKYRLVQATINCTWWNSGNWNG